MRILSAAFAVWIAAASASAHPLAPALLELDEKVDGTVDVVWKTSALKVPGSEVKPVLPADCPLVGTPRIDEGGDSVTAYWTVDCAPAGLVGRSVFVEDLDVTKTDVLLRLSLADGRSMNFVLRATEPSIVIPEKASPLDVAIDYARLGVEHILGGPDHLLFVFGLVLLVPHLRTLIKTVTAFTVGHSVTLTLAVLGFVTYPTGLIELLIAISVFLLAVELARDESSPPGLMRRFPWMVAGLFGLLHGLGFAGALSEVGLPSDEIPLALFTFNVGIELGQLAFVVVVVAARSMLRNAADAAPDWVRQAPLYIMGSLAAFWCFERAASLF